MTRCPPFAPQDTKSFPRQPGLLRRMLRMLPVAARRSSSRQQRGSERRQKRPPAPALLAQLPHLPTQATTANAAIGHPRSGPPGRLSSPRESRARRGRPPRCLRWASEATWQSHRGRGLCRALCRGRLFPCRGLERGRAGRPCPRPACQPRLGRPRPLKRGRHRHRERALGPGPPGPLGRAVDARSRCGCPPGCRNRSHCHTNLLRQLGPPVWKRVWERCEPTLAALQAGTSRHRRCCRCCRCCRRFRNSGCRCCRRSRCRCRCHR